MLALTGRERTQLAICDDQQCNATLDRFSDALVDAGNQMMRQAARSTMESIGTWCGNLLGFNQVHRPGQEVAALPNYSVDSPTRVYGCPVFFATGRPNEHRMENFEPP